MQKDQNNAAMSALSNLEKSSSSSTDMLKFRDVDKTTLGYGGRFYPENWRIQVKPILIGDVKKFTAVNESNFLEVLDATNYIIDNYARIKTDDAVVNANELFVWDRMSILLHIRRVSDIGAALTFEFEASCGHKVVSAIEPETLRYIEIPNTYEKYIVSGGFDIETKSFGKMSYRPTTIKSDTELTAFMRKSASTNDDIDKTFVKLLRFFPGMTVSAAYDAYLNVQNRQQLSLMIKIADALSIGHQNEVAYTCKHCGSTGFRTIEFTDGIRNIFSIPVELDDELV